MNKLQNILWVVLGVLLLVTFIWGSKLSSPLLSASIVITMLGLLINKFVIEFRTFK